jgi:hypothetical protein
MGLLDDAIREHLELRRLRGADPGQVAREEHEALGPVDRGEGRQPEGQATGSDEHGQAPGGQPSEGLAETYTGELSHGGQETTELDMSTVLGESGTQPVENLDTGREPDPAAPSTTGDSLEWEVPSEQSIQSDAEEKLTPRAEASQEPVEDVLEETPDFLRETPEQERLWFEQRPPRDFDFDK